MQLRFCQQEGSSADKYAQFSRDGRHAETSYATASELICICQGDNWKSVPFENVSNAEDGRITVSGSQGDFHIQSTWTEITGRCPYVDVQMDITYHGSESTHAGFQFRLNITGEGRPRWMIPGAFYKENRFAHNTRMYPRYSFEESNPEAMVSDYWAFRADRAALPAVFAWKDELCAALCVDEFSELGLNGLGFRGNSDGTSIWVNFPYREEPVVFNGEPIPEPADVQTVRFEPGELRTISFKVYIADGDLHAYHPFVRTMYDIHREANRLNPWMDMSEAADLTAHGLYTWHYHPEHNILYETAAFDRELNNNVKGLGDRPHMHVAWVSGAPYAHALLMYGRDHEITQYIEAGTSVLDKVASGIAPNGTFWAEWTLERGWGCGWNPNREWLQARTIAEATLFMVRAIANELQYGVAHPGWVDAVHSNLDFATRIQRDDGNFGSYYHCQTGFVEEWDGAGGILWIAALVEAGELFDNDTYREAAKRAGHYYARFIEDEFIYGAPEDVHLTPTSEDAYNAVVSYVLLYEHERDDKWLELAKTSADWMMTFRWTYNLQFPKHSLLAQYDFRSRGADQASPSNQHLHNYGLFCVPEMLRLWRYTNDDYYLQRTRDVIACFLQFIAREDGDFNAYKGMVTERYYNTNCFQPKGMLVTLSHSWCIGVTLYACQVAREFADHLNFAD